MNIQQFLDNLKINHSLSKKLLKPIVLILGSVDNGKTTIFSYLTQKNYIEEYQITQDLYIFENDEVIIIDSPGHSEFGILKEQIIQYTAQILYIFGYRRLKTINKLVNIEEDKILYLYTFTDNQNEEELKKFLFDINLFSTEMGGQSNVKILQYPHLTYSPISEIGCISADSLREYLFDLKNMLEDENVQYYHTEGVMCLVVGTTQNAYRGKLYVMIAVSLGTIDNKGFIIDDKSSVSKFNKRVRQFTLYDYNSLQNIDELSSDKQRLFYLKTEYTMEINTYYYLSPKIIYSSETYTNSPSSEENTNSIKFAIVSQSINKIQVIKRFIEKCSKELNEPILIYSVTGYPTQVDNNFIIQNQYYTISYDIKYDVDTSKCIQSASFYEIEKFINNIFAKKHGETILQNIRLNRQSEAKVIKVFNLDTHNNVYGANILQGTLKYTDKLHVIRKNQLLYHNLEIKNLKISTDDVFICNIHQNVGILLKDKILDILVNDVIISTEMEQK